MNNKNWFFWESLGRLEVSILSVSVTSPADLLQMVSERYDSGDRRLAGDGIIWETDYLKLLKQYNQLTIALRKQIWENFEDMKELVKLFQDCKEPVHCIEENTICENSGLNEEMEGKTDLKFNEEIKDICEEQITIIKENLKGKEEYLNMVEEETMILGKMSKKLLQQNKEVGYKKNIRDWKKKKR